MKSFVWEHMFCSMMIQNTCFNGDCGSCIDLLIANSKFSFTKTNSFGTGSGDHHHMIYTIFKTKFEKFKPKKSIHRNFKQHYSDEFILNIFNSMSAMRTYAAFKNKFISILDKNAAMKTKNLPGNQKANFNKNIRK